MPILVCIWCINLAENWALSWAFPADISFLYSYNIPMLQEVSLHYCHVKVFKPLPPLIILLRLIAFQWSLSLMLHCLPKLGCETLTCSVLLWMATWSYKSRECFATQAYWWTSIDITVINTDTVIHVKSVSVQLSICLGSHSCLDTIHAFSWQHH